MEGLSAVAAALPVLVYVLVIWWLDRYEREPFWLVSLTFIYGATFAIFVSLIGSISVLGELGNPDFFVQAALVAPAVEEPAKAGILLFLLAATRHVDNTTDGLVYGAATGLGFAMTENFFYFQQAHALAGVDGWTAVVVTRSLFSALMHCAASATFGAMLGAFRFRGGFAQWVVAPLLGFVLAFAIHAGFNGALVVGGLEHDSSMTLLGLALVPVLGLTLFIVTQLVLGQEHRMIRDELLAEADTGLMPQAHAKIIPFYFKRRGGRWLRDYEHVDQKRYIKATTLLAFRRYQARRSGGAARLTADVDRLRSEIAAMLSRA